MYTSYTGETMVQYVPFIGEKLLLSYSVRYVKLLKKTIWMKHYYCSSS